MCSLGFLEQVAVQTKSGGELLEKTAEVDLDDVPHEHEHILYKRQEIFLLVMSSFLLSCSSLSPESPEKAPCIEGAISATSVSRTFLSGDPTALTTKGARDARMGVATFARSPVMLAAVKAEKGRM